MKMKFKVKKQLIAWLVIGIFLCPALTGSIFAQESSSATQAGFEAMKAEWTKVREQQIEMILEKEEQLEELKEDLFQQMNELKKAKAGAVDSRVLVEDSQKPKSTSITAVLEKKVADLKEANRQLADEISTLRSQNKELEKKAGASSGLEQLKILQKQMADFKIKKEALKKERQKFFNEMSRQRARLKKRQSFLEAEKSQWEDRKQSEVAST